MIRLKDRTVRMAGMQVELLFGLRLIECVYERFGATPLERTVVVTSITGSAKGRKPNSLHPKGFAADLGLRHVDRPRWKPLRDELELGLSDEWDVILEVDPVKGPHIHVEFDPDPGP